jgi:hypothetical protein
MALFWHNSPRLHATELTDRQMIGQSACGHKNGRLLAEHLCAPPLEPVDRSAARKTVWRNTHCIIASLQPAYQRLGCLRFAITSEDHSNIRIRQL